MARAAYWNRTRRWSLRTPSISCRSILVAEEQPITLRVHSPKFVQYLLATALSVGVVEAAAREWVAAERLGSVLQLEGGSWKEVERAARFAEDVIIRTLQRGQLHLSSGAERIIIHSNTALRLVTYPGSSETHITLHAGKVTAKMQSETSALHFLATNISIAPTAGVVHLLVDGDFAQVAVAEGGEAIVVDSSIGHTVTVTSGAVYSAGGGGVNALGSNAR